MISPRTLQDDLLAYLSVACAAALAGVDLRGSDNTAAIVLPLLVVHIASVEEEWEDSDIYRAALALQLHTQGDDESGETAAPRLAAVLDAMADEEALALALEAHFTISAVISKGIALHHKDHQLIHAARFEILLSKNYEE